MEITIDIPETVADAIRLPENRIEREIRSELALSPYKQGLLSFGKARELAGMGKYEFGVLLGQRQIDRNYTHDELLQDMQYASR